MSDRGTTCTQRLLTETAIDFSGLGLDRQDEMETLSVQFYYTDEFAAVTSDPETNIQGLVDSANTVYSKSKVPLQMEAKCITRLSTVRESGDAVGTLTAFRNSKGKKERKEEPFQL